MPPAARVGDPTAHPGVVTGPGLPTVLVGGQPAAVLGDAHACGFPGVVPHPPTPIAKGSALVLVGGRPVARMTDLSGCAAPIVAGIPPVEIGG
jgi:uncharacterized Zn-binding protein involved in type VI secretion